MNDNNNGGKETAKSREAADADLFWKKPNRQQMTILRRAFAKWSVFEFFEQNKMAILIKDLGGKKAVCISSSQVEPIVLSSAPYSAGMVIGELKKKKFSLNLQGAELFARINRDQGNAFQFPHVVVSEDAEKLVLYGRDIFGSSIVRATSGLNENQVVIILNARGEAIGIGRTRFSGDVLQRNGVAVTTLIDAGHYLRGENQDLDDVAYKMQLRPPNEQRRSNS